MNSAASVLPTAEPARSGPATEHDPRWAAVRTRDASADGQFYYAVRTTGVYCRPSCPSRTPRPENVSFHASREDAERAGYRPCRRCRPDAPSLEERQRALVTAACRAIEDAAGPPPLAELAAQAGLSSSRFHRIFRAHTGLTPRAYAQAIRAARSRSLLGDGEAATDTAYAAGYNSASRFYADATPMLGMAPSRFRNGGDGVEIRFAVGACTLGDILVAATAQGICAILLGDDADALLQDLQHRFPRAQLVGGDAAFEHTVACVVGLVEAPAIGLDLPLDIRGTAFQQRVWEALRRIPAGSTASYAEIAERIGAPAAVRAVAGACAANPIAVAIPCHRVVRSDGGLSGYRWGVERKRALLARERAAGAETDLFAADTQSPAER